MRSANMKSNSFVQYVFKGFSFHIMINVLVLSINGFVDSAAILFIAPIIDILVNPTFENISSITHRIVEIMNNFGFMASVGSFLFLFIGFNLLRSLFLIYASFLILKTKFALLRSIMLDSFEDFFNAKWYFFSNNRQGTFINSLSHDILMVGDGFSAMARYFTQIIQIIFFIIVPFFISWQVSLICVSIAVLLILPFVLFDKISYRLGKESTSTANEISSIIQESFNSAKTILGFGNQRKSYYLLTKAFDAYSEANVKSQILWKGIPQLYYPLGIVVLAVALFSGKKFGVPISEIVVILYSFQRIIPLVGGGASERSLLKNCLPSFEVIMNLRKNANQLAQRTGTKIFLGLNKKIAVEGVSFSYPGYKPVLTEITLQIPKGNMVAFVGKSGSGKSTLIDIIMGFNEPSAGKISIDGVPLENFEINSYRRRIGYVPQDSVLFNMTIRDNLLWAKENATDIEINEACVQANSMEFIERLPEGFNTFVGDRGVRLSGGQIQRLALARAILKKPDVLILDEATSSLDSQSERLIQEAVENMAKKITVIVVAHRLSTVVNADYIYVLEDGLIVEEGTYMELSDNNGLFRSMVDLQLLR